MATAQIRDLVAPTARQAVQLAVDLHIATLITDGFPYPLAEKCAIDSCRARISSDRKRLNKHTRRSLVSLCLRNEISRLLRLGWTPERVRESLSVGPWTIRQIAEQIRASTYKRGRGRRITEDVTARIRVALRTGKTCRQIEQQENVSYQSVKAIRRRDGDFENWRKRKKLSAEQIARAREAVRSGDRWRDVADRLGVSARTLMTSMPYRKREDRRARLTAEEIARGIELLKSGRTWEQVAKEYGWPKTSFQKELGYLKEGPRHRKEIAA